MRHDQHRIIVIDPPQRVVQITGKSFVRALLWIPPIFTFAYFLLGADPRNDGIGEWGWFFIVLACVWILVAKAVRYTRIKPGGFGRIFKGIVTVLVVHAVYRHTRDFFDHDHD